MSEAKNTDREANDELSAIRDNLDRLDERLVELINERAVLAKQIGENKAAAGAQVYAPDREHQVLDRIGKLNRGPMPAHGLRSVYRELMSASLALERAPRVAILGPLGSYSHLVARRKFGTSVEFEPVSSIAALFDEIENGHVEYAIAPTENSIAGGVGETADALIERSVKICGEVSLAVRHHLLGNCPLASVQRVYSKPEVFSQCQKWLVETGLLTKTISMASTSAAAESASKESNAAAIAGDMAAELFGLGKIAEFIEDDSGNVTRFLIIGTKSPQATGTDKTSVVFGVGHEPGRLADVLDAFRSDKINMTRIESRPDRRRKWTYYFFVDFEGHIDTPEISHALRKTADRCNFWKVLGSYPASTDVL